MITKRYMYGTKVPNFIGLRSTSLELLKFIGSYPPNLEIKIKLKINIGCAPPPPPPTSCCHCCPNSPLDRVNQSIDSSHRDVISFIDQRIPQLCESCRGISALPNPSVQLIPHVLYWGQIWTVRWPC